MKHFYKLIFILTLYAFGNYHEVIAQCQGGGTSVGTYIPCAGSTVTSANVSNGNYATFNVVSGLTYTVTANATTTATVTTDAAPTVSIGSISSATTAAFTATNTGLIRIYNCSGAGNDRTFAVTVTGGSNNIDDQNVSGTNTWRAYYYDRLDGSAGAPTDGNAFGRFLGYDVVNVETFDRSDGGDYVCFNLLSQGNVRISMYTEYYATQYRMTSTKLKGIYLADMGADDGIRLKVDGVKVFDRWIEQGYTTYGKQLFGLTGNSNLLYEFYESSGGNRVSFLNFSKVNNIITAPATTSFCGTSAGISEITGNNVFSDAPISSDAAYNNNIKYQWQQSTNNVTYSNISGATAQNYTPLSTLTPNTYYYRRIDTVSRTNGGSIAMKLVDSSNVVTIVVYATPTMNAIADQDVCTGVNTAVVNFSSPNPSNITYAWVNSNTSIGLGASGSGNAIASFVAATAACSNSISNVTVTPTFTNAGLTCPGTSRTFKYTVRPKPNGTITGPTSVCIGKPINLTFTATCGTGPFSVIVNGVTYNNITSGGIINVTPQATAASATTYNLTKITDSNTCTNP